MGGDSGKLYTFGERWLWLVGWLVDTVGFDTVGFDTVWFCGVWFL